MLNLKKVILGLGLLGVVSSANAVCSLELTRVDDYGSVTKISKSINENTFYSFKDFFTEYTVYFNSECILFYSSFSRYISGGINQDSHKKDFILPTKSSLDNSFKNTSAIKTIQTYDDTALKSEDTILKAKVQALETKVYQCVQ